MVRGMGEGLEEAEKFGRKQESEITAQPDKRRGE